MSIKYAKLETLIGQNGLRLNPRAGQVLNVLTQSAIVMVRGRRTVRKTVP